MPGDGVFRNSEESAVKFPFFGGEIPGSVGLQTEFMWLNLLEINRSVSSISSTVFWQIGVRHSPSYRYGHVEYVSRLI